MSDSDGQGVRSTGGQVDELTMALIDAAFDRSEDCQDIISSSIFNLGRKKPELVLSSCYSYLKKHSKLAQGHRVVILQCMEKIIHEELETFDKDLAVNLVKQASQELTESKEVVPEWQTAASGVLVSLGKKYCNEVMEEMLQKFQPGALPHFFVVQTIANLASVNVYGMVPHLTAVLGTMLPMLGMAKQDNMRWVFSSAISKFSEAIIEYIANIDKAPDPTVKKEMFSSEIFSAYDVMFNVWIQSKEMKLRLAIVEAIGHMTHLIARDKLEEQLPRILAGILGLYKRHQEPFHITQGLCSVLEAVCDDGSTILEPHMEHVLGALFPQPSPLSVDPSHSSVSHLKEKIQSVFAPVDYNNPLSMKNQNEVLRCFAVIATSFSGKLTGILLQKLDQNNEKTKIGILTIFKHLINAAAPSMEDKKEVVLSGLKGVAQENSNKVKKAFAQVVIAMGHHDYMELEGGTQMIEFIVTQCSLEAEPPGTKRSPDPDHVTNVQLRHMCDNVLQLLTNTVEQMENVLWPYLLELVVPEKYTEASGVVCRCLATIAAKKREENAEDYDLDYDTQANLPKPVTVIARLMTLAGHPQNGRNRGVHILNLMKALSPNLHDGLVELWDTVIPKLVQYLEDPEKQEDWSQKNWEDLLLKMLSKTLDVIDHEEWIAEVGTAFSDQIDMYSRYPDEKNFLYKCIGVIMRKSTKKDFVNKMLDQVFGTVKHTSQIEREGCAVSLGFCATSHLDAVLTKLETVTKTDMAPKKGGMFSFMKSETKSEGDIERIKATLMLCYGYVALYSPPTLIISRMEATILRSLTPHFANVKDYIVKQNLIRAVDQIGQALHPDHLGQSYNFTNRGEFLTHLQTYMSGEPTQILNNETRALAMKSCTTLVKLDPVLSEADMFDLIKTSTDCIFALPEDGGIVGKKGKGDNLPDQFEIQVLMEATFEALEELLTELLIKNCTPNGFDDILKHLVPWYLSLQDHERQQAIHMTHVLLKYLLENMDTAQDLKFPNEHILLARLVPRCSDPCIEVRQFSMDCIQLTLTIALRCAGFGEDHKDQMVDALPTLRERLEKGDANVLFSVVNDLSKVISKKLPSDQLKPLIEIIQEGLLDPQSHSSSGACVVLNGIMKNRGAELLKEVDHILSSVHGKMFQIQFAQTKTGALRTLRTLAQHHLIPVIKSLLNYPLPFDENVIEIWKILSQDNQLLIVMLDHMLELYHKSLPYEEKPQEGREPIKKATQIPLSITCALVEIFQVEETEEQIKKNYHRLFAALMVRIGSSINVEAMKQQTQTTEKETKDKKKGAPPPPPTKQVLPSSVAVDAFKKFLEITKSEDIIEVLDKEECWEKFEDKENFAEGINILTRALINSSVEGDVVSKIVASLTSVLSSLYDPQRIVVAAFFAELVNQKCMDDDTLIELVMNSLLGRLVDSSHVVRQMCIRGLGNIASIGKVQVQHYSTTVLSAMMAGMDDKEDPEDDITTEAMSGLSRILTEIDETHIRAILINVALRIRPCFEKDKANVRAQAIILFGNLSAFGDGPSKQPFLEQIHSNLVSLLLHLNDPDVEVKKACKFTLRKTGSLLGSESINTMFQRLLLDDANLHYGEFMNDLSKLIIKDFPEKVNFYVMGCVSFYKSMWSEIKSNAALFTGFLLGNLPEERQSIISKEHVCAALILLLKDPNPNVRSAAAEAISLLDKY